ncbi:MAG: LUD domain-containing protein [Anaerolineae bacterium]|nr:LUD domain-containing protein [Anaerolineae bacterium]
MAAWHEADFVSHFKADHLHRGHLDVSGVTFISGPSRTADIEQTLSVGVHGPGEVHVILLDRSAP